MDFFTRLKLFHRESNSCLWEPLKCNRSLIIWKKVQMNILISVRKMHQHFTMLQPHVHDRFNLQISTHLDNGEKRLCIIFWVFQDVICKGKIRELKKPVAYGILFCHDGCDTSLWEEVHWQQKQNSYAVAASLRYRWHLCRFLWTCLELEINWHIIYIISYCLYYITTLRLYIIVIRTIFHSCRKTGLVQIHHAMDTGGQKKQNFAIWNGISSWFLH